MKKYLITVALLSLAAPAYAQQNQDCGNAAACHYNDASITKGDTDNSQNLGDHLNNTYAPDSATSTATGGSVGDIITQGGTGGSAEAIGNTSTNDNRSNANIGANSQSNTGNNNTNTGGNYSQGDMIGGGFHQGDMTGGRIGDTVGGNAQGGNVKGGKATTNAGAIDNRSGVRGSGNSRNANRQGQDQSQESRSRAQARGGDSYSENSQANAQRTTVNANTRVRHSASSAYAAQLNGYGPNNCFGDTNPSGSFTAGIQTWGWGATAARSKASNVCALMAVGGQRAAAAYLASQDPNAHRALVAAGIVTTPSRVKAAEQARQQQAAATAGSLPYRVCEMREGRPYVLAKSGRADEAVAACMATLGQRPAISTKVERAPVPTCPAGSRWDGKGCWMPARR